MIHIVLLIVKFTLLESHLFGHLFANTGLSEIGGPKFIVDKHLFSSIQIAVNVCVCVRMLRVRWLMVLGLSSLLLFESI